MKRLAILAFTALTAIAPLSAVPASADPPNNYQRHDQRDARNDQRDARQDQRQQNRWDARQHNGYSYNGQWHYGPAPSAYQGRPGFQPGYHAWQRGDRVPSYYRDRAHQVDYRRENLRAPPRGYQYVRDDRGSTLLVAVATGVILSAILSH